MKLRQAAQAYENFILNHERQHGVNFFDHYKEHVRTRLLHLKKKVELTKGLRFVGEGNNSEVWTDGKEVLKLLKPLADSEQALLKPPTHPSALNYDYITPHGMAAVQKLADTSPEAKKRAAAALSNATHLNNYGLLNGKPVLVDWE